MPCPLLIFSQSDYLIHVIDTNSNTESQTVQIPIRLLLKEPTDLDLHCSQRQGISGFNRTREGKFDRLSATFTKEDIFYNFLSAFLHSKSLLKGILFKTTQKCVQRTRLPLPEKLKRKLLTPDTDRDWRTNRRTGVTLYALSTILCMVGA